jgi:hypothetical protein
MDLHTKKFLSDVVDDIELLRFFNYKRYCISLESGRFF